MSIIIDSYRYAVIGGSYDSDAQAYITAVETADGQALETGVKDAIDAFVVGCKTDGIWNAIKASCILAGARTRLGALTPLKGAAPTSVNFVDADYNRETGLLGDGSTKYLDSNRNNNADPQDSFSMSAYVTVMPSVAGRRFMGVGGGTTGRSTLGHNNNPGTGSSRCRTDSLYSSPLNLSGVQLIGMSRAAAGSYTMRCNNSDNTVSAASQTPYNATIEVFRGGAGQETNARLAFYHIGESLDLALLQSRVTTMIDAFAAAIP